MAASNALSLAWTFGFNKDIIGGVHSLTTDDRNALFTVSSHSGVIYDFEHRRQTILQGHCNQISCCTVSNDKRWIVTGDYGDESILVVWDSRTGVPVKTIFSPHVGGVVAVDISSDSLFVVSIGTSSAEGDQQDIAIWAWTNDGDSPVLRQTIVSSDRQHAVKFDGQDQSAIVTTGSNTVFFWTWLEYSCEGYCARVTKSEFGFFSGHFTATLHLSGTGNAITSTSDGYVIFWESQSAIVSANGKKHHGPVRSASKVLRLVECGINTMITTRNSYLAIGCADGAIRFYDFFLRLEAWFEDLCAGPITSISLGVQRCPHPEGDAGAPGLRFWIPDFLVGTHDSFILGVESAAFDEVRVEDRRGTLLLQGVSEEVTAIGCHPHRPLLAICCNNGTMHVWDYDLKLLMNLREFNEISATKTKHQEKPLLRPTCLAFAPSGDLLAVGFSCGSVRFLSCSSFEDLNSFSPSTESICSLRFSFSGAYLAGYDSSNHVMIFQRDNDAAYSYIGRIKAHLGRVTGLEFGYRESAEVLLSVGEDRRCVEYDLESSSAVAGVSCVLTDDQNAGRLLDQSALPTALMWHPHIQGDVEDRFVVATSEFKFKELNVDSKKVRRTTLAPTFAAPPTRLNLLPNAGSGSAGRSAVSHFAYCCPSRVLGIGSLPLTGHPARIMGLVAHPGRISAICASFDGRFLFSAGGSDLAVHMWAVDCSVVPCAVAPGGGTLSESEARDFHAFVEGGEGGELHNDIIDYFYYGQLRAQGEDSMESRNVGGKVPLDEIPALMRAIGHFPTELEAHNMISEVKYKTFMNTGETINDIGLNDFTTLYVNHKPAVPLNRGSISEAFDCISQSFKGGAPLTWGELKKLLMSEGEVLSAAELDAYLLALLGSSTPIADGAIIDAKIFATDILGFQSDDVV